MFTPMLALLLDDAGHRVAILERSVEPVVLPRAVNLDGESVRSFQRVGLGDTVAAILQPARDVDRVSFTNSRREPLFGLDIPRVGGNGWRDMAFFDQPELEALLREVIAKRERMTDAECEEWTKDVRAGSLSTTKAKGKCPAFC